MILILMTLIPSISHELGPASPSCFEIGTCDIFADPLNTMLIPWVDLMGPVFYIIVWGLIIGIIWLRTHSTILVGVFGLLIAGFLTAGATAEFGAGALDCVTHDLKCLNNVSTQIILVGGGLMALSIAVV